MRMLAARRPVAVLATVLAAGALVAGSTQAPSMSASAPAAVDDDTACAGPGWVSVWEMPTSDARGAPLPAGSTLRETVYPHLGGRLLRVRLSNRFATTPLVIGGVSVGVQQAGATVVPDTLTPLRFAGSAGITIPAGGEVVSDPAAFSFGSFQALSVSIGLSSATATPAEHVTADQLNWVAAGGLTMVASGTDFRKAPETGNSRSVYSSTTVLSGVDAYSPSTQGAVVALGDSLTDGLLLGGSETSHARWPDVLARRLVGSGVRLAVLNAGISGNRVTMDDAVANYGRSAEHRFTSDVLAETGVRTVIVFEGINDIHAGVHAGSIEAADARLIAAAHASGLRVLLATLTPAGTPGDSGVGAAATQQRLDLNVWIRSQGLADGVIDFELAVANPASPTELDPRYDGGDHLHLNAAGYARLGDAVPLSLLLPAGCIPRRAGGP